MTSGLGYFADKCTGNMAEGRRPWEENKSYPACGWGPGLPGEGSACEKHGERAGEAMAVSLHWGLGRTGLGTLLPWGLY